MKMISRPMINRNSQQGAALIVGLLLLVVITILAVSGMNTATTELAMARNDQTYENVFQAAESGLENALAQPTFNPGAPVVIALPATDLPDRHCDDPLRRCDAGTGHGIQSRCRQRHFRLSL